MRYADELAIVIPYRQSTPDRERIFQWTCDRYTKLIPDAQLVLGEMTSGCEFFCRAEAINNGVRQVDREWLLIADADTIAFPMAIEQAIGTLQRSSNIGRVFPYADYLHLSRASTDTVLACDPADDPWDHARLEVTASYPNSTSGLIVLSVGDFWRSGGFDEISAWGPEDQMWDLAFETLVGPSTRITNFDLYHLYHDVQPGHRADNPHYAESDALWSRYKAAAGDVEQMRELVKEHHP